MKQSFKQVVVISLLFFVFFISSPLNLWAATYGSGVYGVGEYNQGDLPELNVPGAPECNTTPPNSTPWLYAVVPLSTNSVRIVFSDSSTNVENYVLEYGSAPGKYEWSSTNIGGKWTTSYQVSSLLPYKTYYFRVRGSSGCAVGNWSNVLSGKPKPFLSFNQFETTSLTLSPVLENKTPSESEISSVQEKKYSLTATIVDNNEVVIVGARVTLESDDQSQVALTNQNGVANYINLEPGNYQVYISSDGYSGSQSVYLSGDTKTFNLNITVEKKPVLVSPIVTLLLAATLFIFLLWRYKLARSKLFHKKK